MVRRGRDALPSSKHLDKRGRSEEDWFDEQIRNLQDNPFEGETE